MYYVRKWTSGQKSSLIVRDLAKLATMFWKLENGNLDKPKKLIR
jgi:hypothetical protein